MSSIFRERGVGALPHGLRSLRARRRSWGRPTGSGGGAAQPAAPDVTLLPPGRRPALRPSRRLRRPAPRGEAVGVLSRVGAPRRAALHDGRTPRPLPALLRLPPPHRPTDHHGVRPAVLVVFEDEIAADHFLRVARREIARARVELPLRVSHRALIGRVGPLGHAWRWPGNPAATRAAFG